MTAGSSQAAADAATVRSAASLSAGSALLFVVLIGTVSLFSDATYEGGRSLIGQFLAVLGSSALAVGIAAGAGEFLGYALRFVTGYAADRTGAYWRLTILGYTIQLFAMPLLALVGQWQLVVALLFLERIGKAIRNPARDAMLSYATKSMGRGWGFGLHEAMDQIGGFLGPTLVTIVLFVRGSGSGELTIDDYHTAFAVLFVPAVIAVGLLFFARSQFPRPRDLESKTPKLSAQGLRRRYWLYVVGTGFIAAGFADFALIAFHFERTGALPTYLIPMLFAAAMVVDAAAALIAGRLFDRRAFATIVVAFGLGAFFAPLVFLGSLPLVLLGMGLWGIGMAAQESVMRAALADMIPVDRRAYGYGLFSTLFGVFWLAGSALMGALYDVNVAYLVAFSIATQIIALPIFWLAWRAPDPAAA
jgi:MFS family permease